MARLYDHYKNVIRPKLEKEFGYKNQLEIPRLEKIVINMGVGRDAVEDRKAVDAAVHFRSEARRDAREKVHRGF